MFFHGSNDDDRSFPFLLWFICLQFEDNVKQKRVKRKLRVRYTHVFAALEDHCISDPYPFILHIYNF